MGSIKHHSSGAHSVKHYISDAVIKLAKQRLFAAYRGSVANRDLWVSEAATAMKLDPQDIRQWHIPADKNKELQALLKPAYLESLKASPEKHPRTFHMGGPAQDSRGSSKPRA